MRCLPEVTLPTDQPFWVTKASFFAYFDQADFQCRDQVAPVAAYRSDWFCDGQTRFILPTVAMIGGKTQFVSGRHRTAVLLEFLEELPIAFARPILDPTAIHIIEEIPKRSLALTEHIFLPDLPVKDHLP